MLAQVYPREVTFDIGETSLFVEASQEEEMALTVGRNLSLDHVVIGYRTEEVPDVGETSLVEGT